METGVEGAGPGPGGVTGNPVARSERERHGEACERNCVNSGFMSEYARQGWKESFAVDAWYRGWVINGVGKAYSGSV